MSDPVLIPISSDFVITVKNSEPLVVPPDIQKEIEQIWAKGVEERKEKLFNGKVLCLDTYDADHLSGKYVDYKLVFAHHLSQNVRKHLGLSTIGLSGLTRCGHLFLIGKRAGFVTQFPSHYELAPAGTVNTNYVFERVVDFRKQLMDELSEETGITEDAVISVRPFKLNYDRPEGMVDVCVEILVGPDALHETGPHPEYDEIHWVSADQLDAFIKTHQPWVPLSLELIRLAPSELL